MEEAMPVTPTKETPAKHPLVSWAEKKTPAKKTPTTKAPTEKTPAQKAAATRARNTRKAAKEEKAAETAPTPSKVAVQDPADPAKNVDGITAPGTTLGTKSPNPDGITKPGSTLDT